MTRRRFPADALDAIRMRATDANGILRCEGCGMDLTGKPAEVDHIIAEALVPEWKKAVKLTAADGQFLGHCCHRGEDGKTAKDVKAAAKVKRQAKRHTGLARPKQTIQSAGFAKVEKPAKAPARGLSEIARRYGVAE